MALSPNQNQLRKHGDFIVPGGERLSDPVRSIALWSWLNLQVEQFGRDTLGERYLRVRFEDLVHDPVATATRILRFAKLPTDPAIALEEAANPGTLGRWRELEPERLAQLNDVAREALTRLGYLVR